MLTPLVDHILIEGIDQPETTASGIILSTEKLERPPKGRVVAIPTDGIIRYANDPEHQIKIDLEVGDIVYFTKYSPDEIELDGKKLLVVKYTSLLAREARDGEV